MKPKPKRGAPKKSDAVKKSVLLQIRVSESEKDAFAAAAENEGKKTSEWIRDRLRSASQAELEAAGLPVAFRIANK